MVGGRRTGPPVAGFPDVRSHWLEIEVKERRQLPKWLAESVDRARVAAGPCKLGMLIAHQTGEKTDYVIIDRRDFTEWFGWEKEGGN